MRPVSKSLTALLACSIAGGATLSSGLTTAQEPSKASAAKTEKAAKKSPSPSPSRRPRRRPRRLPSPRHPRPSRPPDPPLAEEAQHVARYDAAIAQVRDVVLAAEEAGKLREAIAAAAGSRVQDAKALRDKIADPAARKLVNWYLHRGGFGTAGEIRAFLDANPDWPDRNLLTQRAEEALFKRQLEPARHQGLLCQRRAPHRHRPWPAGVGLCRREGPGQGQGAGAEGLDRPRHAGRRRAGLPQAGGRPCSPRPTTSAGSTACCSTTALDQRAQRARRRHPPHDRAAVERRRRRQEARLAVFLRAKNSQKLLSKLPAHSQVDWGLAVQKAQALRRQKKEEEAWKILLAEPEGAEVAKPDGWWEERRANAYAALRLGKPKMAYDLARSPGMLSVNAGKDASFLAGWLALRHLKDAKLALGHFEALGQGCRRPAEPRARPVLARPHPRTALGNKAKAQEHYRAGSAYFDTFHGSSHA